MAFPISSKAKKTGRGDFPMPPFLLKDLGDCSPFVQIGSSSEYSGYFAFTQVVGDKRLGPVILGLLP